MDGHEVILPPAGQKLTRNDLQPLDVEYIRVDGCNPFGGNSGALRNSHGSQPFVRATHRLEIPLPVKRQTFVDEVVEVRSRLRNRHDRPGCKQSFPAASGGHSTGGAKVVIEPRVGEKAVVDLDVGGHGIECVGVHNQSHLKQRRIGVRPNDAGSTARVCALGSRPRDDRARTDDVVAARCDAPFVSRALAHVSGGVKA